MLLPLMISVCCVIAFRRAKGSSSSLGCSQVDRVHLCVLRLPRGDRVAVDLALVDARPVCAAGSLARRGLLEEGVEDVLLRQGVAGEEDIEHVGRDEDLAA